MTKDSMNRQEVVPYQLRNNKVAKINGQIGGRKGTLHYQLIESTLDQWKTHHQAQISWLHPCSTASALGF